MNANATTPTVSTNEAGGIGPNARYFEDFNIGDQWDTPRRTITEADIVNFAALTGDHNPIHTDEEYAKHTIFGGRILHGPAGFAIATGLEFRLGIKEGTAVRFPRLTLAPTAPTHILATT